jgi:hypothetical protein
MKKSARLAKRIDEIETYAGKKQAFLDKISEGEYDPHVYVEDLQSCAQKLILMVTELLEKIDGFSDLGEGGAEESDWAGRMDERYAVGTTDPDDDGRAHDCRNGMQNGRKRAKRNKRGKSI